MLIQQSLQTAAQHHQAGRLAEAEAIYRQILAAQPDQPDALHLLGMIALQIGQRDDAMELITRAIRLSPLRAEFHCSLGLLLQQDAKLDDAVAEYRTALSLNPDLPEAHNNLGDILLEKKQLDQAMTHLRHAVRIRPTFAEAHYNLANVLKELDRHGEAIESYRKALSLRPQWPSAHNNLGIAHQQQGELEQAVTAFQKSLEQKPDYLPALNNLGIAQQQRGQLEEAAACFQKVLDQKPNDLSAMNNLGAAFCQMNRFDEAVECFRRTLAIQPDYVQSHVNLGNTHRGKGDLEQAATWYKKALALSPGDSSARWNLSLILLMQGQLEAGWPEYECRMTTPGLRGKPPYLQPRWTGKSLPGQRILLHAEQGFGDTIQFIRYAPLVAALGAKVSFACPRELFRLLQAAPGIDQLCPMDQPDAGFDVICPLLSLPGIFKTTLSTIPATIPYLKADAELQSRWREELGKQTGKFKIGIAWAGLHLHADDRNRSFPLSLFAPLATAAPATFFSLQKGEQAAQAKTPPPGMDLVDLSEKITDFADTAAVISHLDLVITADTAIAHLTGAMAKPVWVLIPFVPDWRWMLDRTDSPWYPTMRLFRQRRIGDWHDAIQQVVQALQKTVGGR